MHYLSKTAQKVLQVLADAPIKEFKEIDLIQAAETGKGAAGKLIDALIEEGILNVKRAGKTKILSLNLANPAVFSLKNLFALEKLPYLSKRRLAAALLFAEEVHQAASLLILFGSTSAGTATPNSDIDFMVISKHIPKIELARKKVEESFGLRLNLHIYEELEAANKFKEDHFLQNILFQGVILSGYDLAFKFYLSLEKDKLNLERIFYFQERARAARRNYLQKDYDGASEIIGQLEEQLVFYLLSDSKIIYESRKDAARKIKRLPEAKILFKKVKLREKMDIFDNFIQRLLIDQIVGKRKHGLARRN